MLDLPTANKFDAREINRKAVEHFSTIRHLIFDMRGFPLGEIQKLNPNYVPQPHGIRRHGAPRVVEFRGPMPYPDEGAWVCLGVGGARGNDLIDLVCYLGECPRQVAEEWLGRTVRRLVEVAA